MKVKFDPKVKFVALVVIEIAGFILARLLQLYWLDIEYAIVFIPITLSVWSYFIAWICVGLIYNTIKYTPAFIKWSLSEMWERAKGGIV